MLTVDAARETIVIRAVDRQRRARTNAVGWWSRQKTQALEIPALLGGWCACLQLFEKVTFTGINRIEMRVGAG